MRIELLICLLKNVKWHFTTVRTERCNNAWHLLFNCNSFYSHLNIVGQLLKRSILEVIFLTCCNFSEFSVIAKLVFFYCPSKHYKRVQFSSAAQSCPTLWPHEPQHTRPPCRSPTPRVHPNSCPLSRWCHPTISPSVIPFSSCPQSFPASGSFQMSKLFASGGQSIGVSASTSVLPMNTQDWSPLG